MSMVVVVVVTMSMVMVVSMVSMVQQVVSFVCTFVVIISSFSVEPSVDHIWHVNVGIVVAGVLPMFDLVGVFGNI